MSLPKRLSAAHKVSSHAIDTVAAANVSASDFAFLGILEVDSATEGDLGRLGMVPKNVRRGTAHASIPQYF